MQRPWFRQSLRARTFAPERFSPAHPEYAHCAPVSFNLQDLELWEPCKRVGLPWSGIEGLAHGLGILPFSLGEHHLWGLYGLGVKDFRNHFGFAEVYALQSLQVTDHGRFRIMCATVGQLEGDTPWIIVCWRELGAEPLSKNTVIPYFKQGADIHPLKP